MSTVGSSVIKNIYVGSSKIAKAYLGSSLIYDSHTVKIGGKVYSTVRMKSGSYDKVWMTECLDYQPSGITRKAEASANPRCCYYQNDAATYGHGTKYNYGLLYNVAAVNYLENNKSTLFPGWHVPSSDEYTALKNAFTRASLIQVFTLTTNTTWWYGNNSSGFKLHPSPYWMSGNGFVAPSYYAYLLGKAASSNNSGSNCLLNVYGHAQHGSISIVEVDSSNKSLFQVRLIHD